MPRRLASASVKITVAAANRLAAIVAKALAGALLRAAFARFPALCPGSYDV